MAGQTDSGKTQRGGRIGCAGYAPPQNDYYSRQISDNDFFFAQDITKPLPDIYFLFIQEGALKITHRRKRMFSLI
jgi:hypothetical protein